MTKQNSFMTTLNELGQGACVAELGKAMAELLNEIDRLGKKGAITLKVVATPKPGTPQMLYTYEIKIDTPTPERETTILYFDRQTQDVSRRDPRQPMLPALSIRTGAPVEQAAAEGGN